MRLSVAIIWTALVTSSMWGAQAQETLQAPATFQGIKDRGQRARAIFVELGKVLTHPRCMNCHPAGTQPLQGEEHKTHYPPTHRTGTNVSGETCSTCHADR